MSQRLAIGHWGGLAVLLAGSACLPPSSDDLIDAGSLDAGAVDSGQEDTVPDAGRVQPNCSEVSRTFARELVELGLEHGTGCVEDSDCQYFSSNLYCEESGLRLTGHSTAVASDLLEFFEVAYANMELTYCEENAISCSVQVFPLTGLPCCVDGTCEIEDL